jgi:hypothetical protein
MSTLLPREVDRITHTLLFDRRMKATGADEGRRTDTRPRHIDRSEMALLWELQDYYARMAEEQWEAGAASRA